MAKGRKFTSSRSDRFLGTTYTQPSTNNNHSSDLREEDIWSTTEERHHHRHVGGMSLTFEDLGRRRRRSNNNGTTTTTNSTTIMQYRAHDAVSSRHHMATSAPVNVPDWSKILRVESVQGMDDYDNDDEEEEEDSEMVPPHEYLARKKAANSVFEGLGRTLKGRDLSRVRDAVWSQTGFDG